MRRLRLVLIGTAGLISIALIEPHILRFGVKHGLIFKAKRHGTDLAIGTMEGSIFEPLVFRDVRLASARHGIRSDTRVKRAEAHFSWSALLLRRGLPFFNALTLDGVRSEITFEPETAAERSSMAIATPEERSRRSEPWLPPPARLDLWKGEFTVHMGSRILAASEVRFKVSGSAPGEISIGRLTARQPSFRKTFTGLRGTTAMQGSRLVLADLQLTPEIWLKNLSTDIANVSQSELRVSFDFAAFGGIVRGELVNTSGERHPNYEIAGNFAAISVPALARFMEVREETGGTLTEGKFTFRGSPHALEKAALTTRFEAVDFLWGSRRWNSLVLGATILNGRVQIPQLILQQAHNSLRLNGELVLPANGTPWWESEFNFDVDARIDNLTELSALFGPRFSDTAGKMTVVGAIRGQNKTFAGQLIVSGTALAYRGTPIDLLNAGIKLEGNELHVINLEMAHGRDFVRGKGTVNIFGEKRYRAELRASIGELADYRPLLQKPITPAPLEGGVTVDWSGDGTLEAHSGAFAAAFRKVRTSGSPEVPATLPIDAELEGTYAPGSLFLSKCILANDGTRFETRLAADQSTLKLEGVKLTQKGAPWLEGDAALPVNLWQWWLAPSLAALAPDAPFKVALKARGVELDEVATLTGHPVPVSGILSGNVQTEGTLRNVQMTGDVKLTKGRIPANAWLPALDHVEAEAALEGTVLRFGKLSARHAVGTLTASGGIDFSKFDSPTLDLAVLSEEVAFETAHDWKGKAGVDLAVVGTREHARITGTANLTALEACPVPDFGRLIVGGDAEGADIPPPTLLLPAPLNGWQFDVAVSTPLPVKLGRGEAAVALRYAGTGGPGGTLRPTGSVRFSDLPLKTEFAEGRVETASFYWSSEPGEPRLAARISGRASDTGFVAYYLGRMDHLSSTFVSQPERSEADLRLLLRQGYVPLPSEAGEFAPVLAAPFNAVPDVAPEGEPAAAEEAPAASDPAASAAPEETPADPAVPAAEPPIPSETPAASPASGL